LAQILVFKPLRIHARVPVIASAAGFMSVAFASAMAAKSFKAARNNYTAASEIFSKGSFSSADKDRASKWLNEQLAGTSRHKVNQALESQFQEFPKQ
jgi:hypothetical protein